MPEAPDLEVMKESLEDRAAGAVVMSATVLKPSVLRSLAGDFTSDIQDRSLDAYPAARQNPADQPVGPASSGNQPDAHWRDPALPSGAAGV